MAKKPSTVSITTEMKATPSKSASVKGNSTQSTASFSFGWEGTAFDELTYEARAIVDNVWPNTDTPDIVNGVWDHTPIMAAVLTAIRRGIEIGQGDDIADA